jgi:hypothetical protein
MNQNQLNTTTTHRSVDQQQACSALPCPVCGGEARRGKHGAVECVRYCTRSAMRPTWKECVEDWNSPDFRPRAGPFTRSDLGTNGKDDPR